MATKHVDTRGLPGNPERWLWASAGLACASTLAGNNGYVDAPSWVPGLMSLTAGVLSLGGAHILKQVEHRYHEEIIAATSNEQSLRREIEASNEAFATLHARNADLLRLFLDLPTRLDDPAHMQQLVTTVAKTMRASAASFYKWEPQRMCFHLTASFGSNGLVMPGESIMAGDGMIGSRYVDPRMVAYGNVRKELQWLNSGVTSVICLPVFAAQYLYGVLTVGFEQENAALEEDTSNFCCFTVQRMSMQIELSIATKRYEEAANRDIAMTQLYNRQFFNRHIPLQLASLRSINDTAALIWIDLDYFKQINDTHGHERGDRALIRLAEIMRSNVHRTSDLCFRMGGDEFVIFLPSVTADKAYQVARAVARDWEKETEFWGNIVDKDTKQVIKRVKSSLSIGIAMFPEHGTDKDSLIVAADGASYVVKNATKNDIRMAQ